MTKNVLSVSKMFTVSSCKMLACTLSQTRVQKFASPTLKKKIDDTFIWCVSNSTLIFHNLFITKNFKMLKWNICPSTRQEAKTMLTKWGEKIFRKESVSQSSWRSRLYLEELLQTNPGNFAQNITAEPDNYHQEVGQRIHNRMEAVRKENRGYARH